MSLFHPLPINMTQINLNLCTLKSHSIRHCKIDNVNLMQNKNENENKTKKESEQSHKQIRNPVA